MNSPSTLQEFLDAIPPDGILSLDVFDTALTRSVAEPTHIFAVMQEHLLNKNKDRRTQHPFRDFIAKRILAEQDSRRDDVAHLPETTLDRIYKKLGEDEPELAPFVEKLKALESETEIRECRPIPEIKELFDKALARGLTVIFTSDMYLPRDTISRMLEKCGYIAPATETVPQIFLSAELNHTKWSGEIWEDVLAAFGAERLIFHIGDNKYSDAEVPKKFGITTFHFPAYSKTQKHYFGFSEALVPLSRWQTTNRKYKALNGPLATDGNQPLARVARNHLALLFGSFVKWIDEQVRLHGAKTCYFFARDGFILKKFWDALAKRNLVSEDVHAVYAEVSRRALWVPAITKVDDDLIYSFLVGGGKQNRPMRVFLERIGIKITDTVLKKIKMHFNTPDDNIVVPWETPALIALFRDLAPEILEVAKKEREVALAYFQEIGFFDEPFPKVIVDLGWHATLQAKLHELLSIERNYPKENVVGLYAGLFAMTLKNTFTRGIAQGMCWSPFDSHEWQSRTWPVVQLLEILHMAPHGSVCGYRKSSESSENVPENAGENAGESTAPHYEAVHADNPLECELHQKIVGPMQELALESLLNGLDSGGIIWEELSPNVFLETWKDLAFYPSSTEAAALGQLLHWDGIEHTGEGVPLVPPPPANETEAAELMKKTLIWLPGMLRQWKTENVLKKDVFDKLVWNSDRLTNETKRYLTQ